MFKINLNNTQNTQNINQESEKLAGKIIKEIFQEAQSVSNLHKMLTSPRGEYFRMHLLQQLKEEMSREQITLLRKSQGLEESVRHLHKLLEFKLIEEIEIDGKKGYQRTELGEKAINAIRGLQRKFEALEEDMNLIFKADLGINSLQLFLRVYGREKGMEYDKNTGKFVVRYKPEEIGRIAKFLPRSVDGVAAIDKLDDAKLVFYNQDDGKIYVPPKKARAFYQYLKRLHSILKESAQIQ